MKKDILKSNAAIMVVGQNPAWTTTLDSGNILSLVQNSTISVGYEHQKSKQVGSYDYAVNDIVRAPRVDLTFDYYLTPYVNNEINLGFVVGGDSYSPSLTNMKSRNQNIYMIIDTEDGRDGIYQFKSPSAGKQFSGYCALNIGNCYMTKYSVQYAINSIPMVQVGFSASNLNAVEITGGLMKIPAINPISGNSNSAGNLNLSGLYASLTGNALITGRADGRTELNAPVALSNKSIFTLENLQVGGVPLSTGANPILQTMSLDIDMAREEMYGFGSNYVFDRKLAFPVAGTVAITCLVSGLTSGTVASMLSGESGYSFEIAFRDNVRAATGYYKVDGAKLESSSYSMQVNEMMNFSASFSFRATNSAGFSMRRVGSGVAAPAGAAVWDAWNQIWENINIQWQNA